MLSVMVGSCDSWSTLFGYSVRELSRHYSNDSQLVALGTRERLELPVGTNGTVQSIYRFQ